MGSHPIIFLAVVRSAFLPLTPCGAVRSYFFFMFLPEIFIIMSASSSIVTSLSEPMFTGLLYLDSMTLTVPVTASSM